MRLLPSRGRPGGPGPRCGLSLGPATATQGSAPRPGRLPAGLPGPRRRRASSARSRAQVGGGSGRRRRSARRACACVPARAAHPPPRLAPPPAAPQDTHACAPQPRGAATPPRGGRTAAATAAAARRRVRCAAPAAPRGRRSDVQGRPGIPRRGPATCAQHHSEDRRVDAGGPRGGRAAAPRTWRAHGQRAAGGSGGDAGSGAATRRLCACCCHA
jgi:hypothetical protein